MLLQIGDKRKKRKIESGHDLNNDSHSSSSASSISSVVHQEIHCPESDFRFPSNEVYGFHFYGSNDSWNKMYFFGKINPDSASIISARRKANTQVDTILEKCNSILEKGTISHQGQAIKFCRKE